MKLGTAMLTFMLSAGHVTAQESLRYVRARWAEEVRSCVGVVSLKNGSPIEQKAESKIIRGLTDCGSGRQHRQSLGGRSEKPGYDILSPGDMSNVTGEGALGSSDRSQNSFEVSSCSRKKKETNETHKLAFLALAELYSLYSMPR